MFTETDARLSRTTLPQPALDALLHLTDAVGSATTLAAVCDAGLDGVQQALGVDRAAILLFGADGTMRSEAWRGLSDRFRAVIEQRPPWRHGDESPDPVFVPDVRADISFRDDAELFASEQVAAFAFFPLSSRRRAIGALMLVSCEPRAFSAGEISLALTIGHLIGSAVDRTLTEIRNNDNHQRLLFALDAAQMGTWEWDVRTEQVRWSENLEHIHGLPPGTFDGTFASYEREIHRDDRARVMTSLQRALTEGTIHDVEYRIVAPDGQIRWVQGKGRVERDAVGRPVKMSGVCMDITVRKRAEAEIAAALEKEEAVRDRLTVLATGSQQLLTALDTESVIRHLLSLAPRVVAADAYAVWRRTGDVWRVAASQGLSDEFIAVGVTSGHRTPFEAPIVAEDVLSTPILDVRHALYAREGIRSLVSVPLVVRGDHAGSIVFYHRLPYRPSEVDLHVAMALGQLAAAAVSNAELYAEQQALRASAQQGADRAAFLAEASASLSSLDYETNLRRVTEIAAGRLGDWCAADLLDGTGAINRIAIAHADPSKTAAAVQAYRAAYPPRFDEATGIGSVIRTGIPELYPEIPDAPLAEAAHDDEEIRMLQALGLRSAMIVPLATGARTFGAMTFASISPGRRYGREDLEFAVELARRTAYAVENARLYHEAQEANRLKDEFLATLSHELRTPLNVMLGRTRMLQHTAGTESMQTALRTIERNGAALTRLVEDLLDLSRITLGSLRLESAVVNMSDVIEAVIQGILPAASAKSVTLQVEAALPDASITGDATRLQQVVWNLLVNAVKFTPPGGRVTLTLSAEPAHLVLDVSDTGSGIDPAFLPHVFEMFRQAQPPAERSLGGLGVGLSIVRRLVELHGGTVAAASAGVGQGATFTVRLPR